MHYTLRQLEVFLAVAHYENVTRAADHLAMSQSACSGALKDLEQQYDVQLFDRIGKRLKTNEFGKLIRPRAEALLAMARELEGEFKRHRTIGPLTLGATLTIGNYLAINLIRDFMQKFAGARVTLNVANTRVIGEQLLNYEIDLGMVEGELQHPELLILPWRRDELQCFCAPDHPFARRGALSDRDLVEATWILRETGSGTRQAFDRAMGGITPELSILLELQHTEAIKRAVESGLGISCLSAIALTDAFKRGSLVPLSVPGRNFSRQLYVAIHRQKYRSQGLLQWLELCGLSSAATGGG